MSINIDLGDKVVFTVPVNDKSGFLYGVSQDMGHSAVVELKYLLKDISDISLTDYVYFLTHEKDRSVIFEKEVMVDCLKIYNITGDHNYFDYLIVQLHKFWTLLSPILYSSNIGVDHNIMWDIHLHTPHQLLPSSFVNNKKFYDSWLELNTGNKIVLNGVQEFTYKTVISNKTNGAIFTYVDPGNKSNIDKEVLSNRQLTQYNGNTQGNNTEKGGDNYLASSTVYINGKRNGLNVEYGDDNGQLPLRKVYYLDDLKYGVETDYYEDGKPMIETNYNNGIVEGQKRYYDDEQCTLQAETQYVSGSAIKGKYFYVDGNYAVITYLPTEDIKYINENTITMFNQHDIPIWRIVYGNPTIQYFFDIEGNIIHKIIYNKYVYYILEDRKWR